MSEQEDSQYRFSGYQLNLITLDETGPSYAVTGVHPYYRNQPLSWQKEFSYGNSDGTPKASQSSESTMIYPMLPGF
jgi:hypothetical protein